MQPHQTRFTLSTRGQGLYEFTEQVKAFVMDQPRRDGLLALFVQHTSCSLLVQENADPEVQTDMRNFFAHLVPPTTDPEMAYLTHTYEGPDDMPAHIKAALTATSITIPIIDGRLCLGTWQGIYLFEHRDHSHHRNIVAHVST